MESFSSGTRRRVPSPVLVWERLIQPCRERKAEQDAVLAVTHDSYGQGSIRGGDLPPVA